MESFVASRGATWEEATHMRPDAYEIAHDQLWYFRGTSTLRQLLLRLEAEWMKLLVKKHWFCLGLSLYVFAVVSSSSKIIF